MIKKLNSIKDFGIFRNFVDTSDLQEFSKYNLFYGWNGSGKSTFSKLFDCLNTNELDIDFKRCSFKVTLKNGEVIDDKSVLKPENDIKISIFNSRFVKENIDWDNITKSLLYISKEKVDDKKALVELKEDYRDLVIDINKGENKIEKLGVENANFLSAAAKEVKTQFEVLSTDDKYYLNYDKRKFENIIKNNVDKIKAIKLVAKAKEIDGLKMTARLQKLDKIETVIPTKFKLEEIQKLEEDINLILKKNITSSAISSLKKNPKVSSWIESGLQLHKTASKCKFCKNTIEQTRIDELNSHFNDDFRLLKKGVLELIDKVDNVLEKIKTSLLEDVDIYPFLKVEFNKQNSNLRTINGELFASFLKSQKSLREKLDNPFLINVNEVSIANNIIEKFNNTITSIEKVIQTHNSTSDNFQNYIKSAKQKLELSIAQSEVRKFKYFSKLRQKRTKRKA